MGCAAVWDVMRAVMTVTIFYNFLPSWFPIRENLQVSMCRTCKIPCADKQLQCVHSHAHVDFCTVDYQSSPLRQRRSLVTTCRSHVVSKDGVTWCLFCLSPPLWALIAEPLHAYRDDTILEVSEPWCGKSANLMLTSWPVKSEQGISSIQFQVAGLRGFWTPVSKPFRCFQGSVCLARTRQAVWGLAGRRDNR